MRGPIFDLGLLPNNKAGGDKGPGAPRKRDMLKAAMAEFRAARDDDEALEAWQALQALHGQPDEPAPDQENRE